MVIKSQRQCVTNVLNEYKYLNIFNFFYRIVQKNKHYLYKDGKNREKVTSHLVPQKGVVTLRVEERINR